MRAPWNKRALSPQKERSRPTAADGRPATSTGEGARRAGDPRGETGSGSGALRGDRLEFRVGRQRAAPPSFAPPPNPPRPRPTLSPFPSSVSSVSPLCSTRDPHAHSFSLAHDSSPNSSLNRARGVSRRTDLAGREPGRPGMLGEWISASHTWTKVDRKVAVLD